MERSSFNATPDTPGHDIIVIGGSSGGFEALRALLAKLPSDLPAAIFVVIHTAETGPYFLPKLLQRHTALKLATVEDKRPISLGRVYVARPNLHLLLEDAHIRVVLGPKENRLRPAIDPLFRSAAWAYRSRVTGILLSGGLDDGVAGLWDIRCCGGATIVQEPDSASSPGLLYNALSAMKVDSVAPPEQIAEIVVRLADTPPDQPEGVTEQDRIRLENSIDIEPIDHAEQLQRIGELAGFTCPGCGGPLWKLPAGAIDRYRCRVGHGYSGASLFQACWDASERKLYSALQLLEENAQIGNQAIRKAEQTDRLASPELVDQVRRLEKEADILRDLLYRRNSPEARSE